MHAPRTRARAHTARRTRSIHTAAASNHGIRCNLPLPIMGRSRSRYSSDVSMHEGLQAGPQLCRRRIVLLHRRRRYGDVVVSVLPVGGGTQYIDREPDRLCNAESRITRSRSWGRTAPIACRRWRRPVSWRERPPVSRERVCLQRPALAKFVRIPESAAATAGGWRRCHKRLHRFFTGAAAESASVLASARLGLASPGRFWATKVTFCGTRLTMR
jgi:hypothetical protein